MDCYKEIRKGYYSFANCAAKIEREIKSFSIQCLMSKILTKLHLPIMMQLMQAAVK